VAGGEGPLTSQSSPAAPLFGRSRARFFGSRSHELHAPTTEWGGSGLIVCAETPDRAKVIEAALETAGALFEEAAPATLPALERIHSADYLDYLAHAAQEWLDAGYTLPAASGSYAPRGVPVAPGKSILGRSGYYSFGLGSPVIEGTWEASLGAAGCAIDAANAVLDGADLAYGLCRPPGHHAGRDYGGGYCYINNAALAADLLASRTRSRGGVAIIDLDYHHGNGSQDLFWDRSDVTYVSIHADPDHDYPYFTGRKGERGAGDGEGLTLNYPLPLGSGDDEWVSALEDGLRSIPTPTYIVVSLGLDAEAGDERFQVTRSGFAEAGRRLRDVAPMVVLLEGGYLVSELGRNTTAFLAGEG